MLAGTSKVARSSGVTVTSVSSWVASVKYSGGTSGNDASSSLQPDRSACCRARMACSQSCGLPQWHFTRLSTPVLIRLNSRPTIVTVVPPCTGPPVGWAE